MSGMEPKKFFLEKGTEMVPLSFFSVGKDLKNIQTEKVPLIFFKPPLEEKPFSETTTEQKTQYTSLSLFAKEKCYASLLPQPFTAKPLQNNLKAYIKAYKIEGVKKGAGFAKIINLTDQKVPIANLKKQMSEKEMHENGVFLEYNGVPIGNDHLSLLGNEAKGTFFFRHSKDPTAITISYVQQDNLVSSIRLSLSNKNQKIHIPTDKLDKLFEKKFKNESMPLSDFFKLCLKKFSPLKVSALKKVSFKIARLDELNPNAKKMLDEVVFKRFFFLCDEKSAKQYLKDKAEGQFLVHADGDNCLGEFALLYILNSNIEKIAFYISQDGSIMALGKTYKFFIVSPLKNEEDAFLNTMFNSGILSSEVFLTDEKIA